MSTVSERRLMQWLRDAHAMERQAKQKLSAMVERLAHYPELRTKFQEHLRETEAQITKLEGCIERRGGDPSTFKDAGSLFLGMIEGFAKMMSGDEVMKGLLASYTFEHMEIGSYRMLIAAAEFAGDRETARVCGEILREEEAMAEWLAQHEAELTAEYLRREDTDNYKAKR